MADRTQTPRPRRARPATMADVAAHSQVSVATVSRVLSGNYPVAEATRNRVLRAVTELDYVANANARALKGDDGRLVAVLLHDVTSPFFNQIVQGVEREAAAEGRLCMVCTTSGDPAREDATITMLRQHQVEVLILVGGVVDSPAYRDRMGALATNLDASGSRLVMCARPSPGVGVPATVVEYDIEGGSRAATSYLLSLGHERILLLGGPEGSTISKAHVAGYKRAHAAAGMRSDRKLIVPGPMDRAFGYTCLRRLIDRPGVADGFTAIMAANDLIATGAMAALHEAGRRVPEDVSVVGFDDTWPAEDLRPTLTTVHVPHQELGRTAVRLALHRHDAEAGCRQITLDTHLVVRDSTAPPAGAR
ncbi:LacI family DNA-binding transcriptional regulator [Nonomuraea sp. NPDC046802]|uniref:LacI family DNA-binding transcriptional regulator n=1 Tax=Nonomuraea sp. NPDC046802 TaxID=3154919 RepID=UPI0033DEBAA2